MHKAQKYFKGLQIVCALLKIVAGTKNSAEKPGLKYMPSIKTNYIAEHELIDFGEKDLISNAKVHPFCKYKYKNLSYAVINPSIESIDIEEPEENVIFIKDLSVLTNQSKKETDIKTIRIWPRNAINNPSVVTLQYKKPKENMSLVEECNVSPISPLNTEYNILLLPYKDSQKPVEKFKAKSLAEYAKSLDGNQPTVYIYAKSLISMAFSTLLKNEIEKAGNNSTIGANKFISALSINGIDYEKIREMFSKNESFYAISSKIKRHSIYNRMKEIEEIKRVAEEEKDPEETYTQEDESSTEFDLSGIRLTKNQKKILKALKEEKINTDAILDKIAGCLEKGGESINSRDWIDSENKNIIGSMVDNIASYAIESSDDLLSQENNEKKAQVHASLSIIEEYIEKDETDELIEKEKGNIIRIICPRTGLNRMHGIKEYVEEIDKQKNIIIDTMIAQLINHNTNSRFGTLENIIKKEIKLIEKMKNMDLFQSIDDLTYGYNCLQTNSLSLSDLRDSLEKIFTRDSSNVWHIEKTNISYSTLKELCNSFKEIFIMESTLKSLNSYNEIWESPVILYCLAADALDAPEISDAYSEIGTDMDTHCYIQMFSKIDNCLHKRRIKYTEKNLEAFKNAQTIEEVNSIESE